MIPVAGCERSLESSQRTEIGDAAHAHWTPCGSRILYPWKGMEPAVERRNGDRSRVAALRVARILRPSGVCSAACS
jgi:hypothetical protein